MALLGVFAGVAVILAAVGIYGVIAYSVSQRTKEIGIRMALGAQRTEMLQMILRQSLWTVAIGMIACLAGALVADDINGGAAFRNRRNRHFYLRHCNCSAWRRCAPRQFYSRAPGHESRSDGRRSAMNKMHA